MPESRTRTDGNGRDSMPTLISSVVGRLSDASMAVNAGLPPVPGPTLAMSGPTPCEVHRDTVPVDAAGSPYARVSSVSASAVLRYDAKIHERCDFVGAHQNERLGSTLFQL